MILGALVVPFGMRVAVASLIIFFLAGALILLTVDEKAGIEAAGAAEALMA